MITDFTKLLLLDTADNKSADFVRVFNNFVFEEFYPKALDTKRYRLDPELATDDYLREALWSMGKELLTGDNFLARPEYARREFVAESRKIYKKTTSDDYLNTYHVFSLSSYVEYLGMTLTGSTVLPNLPSTIDIYVGARVYGKGIPLGATVQSKSPNSVVLSVPTTLTQSAVIIRFENEGSYPLIKTITPPDSIIQWDVQSANEASNSAGSLLDQDPGSYELDFDLPNILEYDSFGNPIFGVPNEIRSSWYLDGEAFFNLTTRHFILGYEFTTVEVPQVFLTPETQEAFLMDVRHSKRLLETPHFEARLVVPLPKDTLPPDPNSTITYVNEFDPTITGEMDMVCFTPDFTKASRIQFGKGRRTDLDQAVINSDVLSTGLGVAERFDNENPYFVLPSISGGNSTPISDLFVDPLHYSKSYLPPITKVGSITGGSDILFLTDTADLDIGNLVVGPGLPANTTIQSIDSATQITLTNVSAMSVAFANIGFTRGVYVLSEVGDQSDLHYSFPITYFRIEEQSKDRLVLRNFIFPYHKWSSFTEFAIFDELNEVIMYATFPEVTWHKDMLSSIYLDIKIDNTLAPETVSKYFLPFDIPNWIGVTGPSGGDYTISVTFNPALPAITGFPGPRRPNAHVPYVQIFRDMGGGQEQFLNVEGVSIALNGTVTVSVPQAFKGYMIIL